MNGQPNISRLAALIADPSRGAMLGALMDGRALTAGELSQVAGVMPQTASLHLAKLVDGQLLVTTSQGRHRYFKLKDSNTAELLETMLVFSAEQMVGGPITGPKNSELRYARLCYDHLAGELGVTLLSGLALRKAVILDVSGEHAQLTSDGERVLENFGIDIATVKKNRRPVCRTCLDWSERRPHLAGGLGAALWQLFTAKNWAKTYPSSRAVRFTPEGMRHFQSLIRND